jgi:hypothetical protein
MGPERRQPLGSRAIVLVVDANHHFLGDDPEEGLLEANRRWPYSCGPDGWQAVAQLAQLLPEAR